MLPKYANHSGDGGNEGGTDQEETQQLVDPDRSSEEADAVGRPDSEKGVQELEDYYERRKRLRLLAIEMAKRGDRRTMPSVYDRFIQHQSGGYGSGGNGKGGGLGN